MPTAVAIADVYAGKAPLRVNFDSSGSTDPDGTIISYYWEFMDGNTSTDANPSHRFTDPGSYAVTLTVTDDQGMSASNSVTITVTKANGKKK
jgi:PKD repeat protein